MKKEIVEEWACTNKLDIRELSDNHWRLLNTKGLFTLDVYFAHTKLGKVKWNTIHVWKTKRYHRIFTLSELNKYYYSCI